jgi:lipopolysaccharide transport system permease protein
VRFKPRRPAAADLEAHHGPLDLPSESQPAVPTILIEPRHGWPLPSLRELWAYRELLFFLAWRDIKVRYKQTAIGAAWAILQPFLTMVVFSVIFGSLLAVPSDGIPYPIFAYAALVPWTFFASCVALSSNSLVRDANLISKVYFPRLLVPLAATIGPIVDFAIAGVLLLAMLVFYAIVPGPALLTLPLFLGLAFLTALSVGIWLAAVNVRYRDVAYVVPFLTQFWLFVTPVAYPASLIPEPWRAVYGLNPMAGVIEGFRWALLGTASVPVATVTVSAIVVIVVLLSGIHYFQRTESEFADVV